MAETGYWLMRLHKVRDAQVILWLLKNKDALETSQACARRNLYELMNKEANGIQGERAD
jgi:hypothetical protein